MGFESHPLGTTMEYQNLGELTYVAKKQRAALEYIRNNPRDFAARSLHRVVSFWMAPKISKLYWLLISLLSFTGLGLALRKRKPGAPAFLLIIFFYPLVYYVTYVFPKYRHPIEPLLFVFAAYPVVCFARFIRLRLWGEPRGRRGKPSRAPRQTFGYGRTRPDLDQDGTRACFTAGAH